MLARSSWPPPHCRPPMAQVPRPIEVISRSLCPSRRLITMRSP